MAQFTNVHRNTLHKPTATSNQQPNESTNAVTKEAQRQKTAAAKNDFYTKILRSWMFMPF